MAEAYDQNIYNINRFYSIWWITSNKNINENLIKNLDPLLKDWTISHKNPQNNCIRISKERPSWRNCLFYVISSNISETSLKMQEKSSTIIVQKALIDYLKLKLQQLRNLNNTVYLKKSIGMVFDQKKCTVVKTLDDYLNNKVTFKGISLRTDLRRLDKRI